MFLPSSSLPFISAMAFNMACSSAKVTKPKPLDLPVSRSEMTLLCVTSPKELKALSSRLSSVAQARPPTKHRYSDSPIFFREKEKKKKNHPTSALNSKLQTQHTRLQTQTDLASKVSASCDGAAKKQNKRKRTSSQRLQRAAAAAETTAAAAPPPRPTT